LTSGIVHFDLALLQSNHLLVDESALTGEIHPISKLPLDPTNSDLTYSSKDNKNSTIFAGTKILECGLNDIGIVTQTGSFTAKGELLSDVLSFEPHKFKFHNEIKIVLSILFVEMLILVTFVLNAIEGKLMLTNSITILFLSATPHSAHFFSTVSSSRLNS
jgi:magnesium-transporting ATPase (P-type)